MAIPLSNQAGRHPHSPGRLIPVRSNPIESNPTPAHRHPLPHPHSHSHSHSHPHPLTADGPRLPLRSPSSTTNLLNHHSRSRLFTLQSKTPKTALSHSLKLIASNDCIRTTVNPSSASPTSYSSLSSTATASSSYSSSSSLSSASSSPSSPNRLFIPPPPLPPLTPMTQSLAAPALQPSPLPAAHSLLPRLPKSIKTTPSSPPSASASGSSARPVPTSSNTASTSSSIQKTLRTVRSFLSRNHSDEQPWRATHRNRKSSTDDDEEQKFGSRSVPNYRSHRTGEISRDSTTNHPRKRTTQILNSRSLSLACSPIGSSLPVPQQPFNLNRQQPNPQQLSPRPNPSIQYRPRSSSKHSGARQIAPKNFDHASNPSSQSTITNRSQQEIQSRSFDRPYRPDGCAVASKLLGASTLASSLGTFRNKAQTTSPSINPSLHSKHPTVAEPEESVESAALPIKLEFSVGDDGDRREDDDDEEGEEKEDNDSDDDDTQTDNDSQYRPGGLSSLARHFCNDSDSAISISTMFSSSTSNPITDMSVTGSYLKYCEPASEYNSQFIEISVAQELKPATVSRMVLAPAGCASEPQANIDDNRILSRFSFNTVTSVSESDPEAESRSLSELDGGRLLGKSPSLDDRGDDEVNRGSLSDVTIESCHTVSIGRSGGRRASESLAMAIPKIILPNQASVEPVSSGRPDLNMASCLEPSPASPNTLEYLDLRRVREALDRIKLIVNHLEPHSDCCSTPVLLTSSTLSSPSLPSLSSSASSSSSSLAEINGGLNRLITIGSNEENEGGMMLHKDSLSSSLSNLSILPPPSFANHDAYPIVNGRLSKSYLLQLFQHQLDRC